MESLSCMFNSLVSTALIIDSYHEYDSNQFLDSSSRLNIYSFERGAVIVRLALVFLLEKFRHRKNVRLLSIGTGILKLVNLR